MMLNQLRKLWADAVAAQIRQPGETDSALARRLGCTRQQLYKNLRGECSIEWWAKVAAAHGIRVTQFGSSRVVADE